MKVEIEYYIEIPITITCQVEKGEPRTHDYPGSHDHIVDFEYKFDIGKEIKAERHLIYDDIWEEVKEMKDASVEEKLTKNLD